MHRRAAEKFTPRNRMASSWTEMALQYKTRDYSKLGKRLVSFDNNLFNHIKKR